MITSAALLALACYVAAPAPLLGDDVHRALRGEPVPSVLDRMAVVDALRASRRRSSR